MLTAKSLHKSMILFLRKNSYMGDFWVQEYTHILKAFEKYCQIVFQKGYTY